MLQMGQAGLVLRRMAEMCEGLAVPPLGIFTGDFNSTPQSGIYTFVRDGELDCYMEDRRNLSGQLETEERGWPPAGFPNNRGSQSPLTMSQRIRVRDRSVQLCLCDQWLSFKVD